MRAPRGVGARDAYPRLSVRGHTPWTERQARGRFYEVLKEELRRDQ